MDFIAGASVLLDNVKLPEFFDSDSNQPVGVPPKQSRFAKFTSFLIGVIIGGYSAYLSWTCNTALNASLPVKILWAIVAWFFGLLYLLCYAFVWSTSCYVAKQMNPPKK